MKDYVQESRRHFDAQAATYDQNTSTYYSGPAKVSCADAEKYLKTVKYETLLDVGCGTGYLMNALAQAKPARYFGLDLSENMLKEAEKKHIPGCELTQGTADALPWKEGTFDAVTCIQSFHHYPDPDKAMAEAYRVLKKGGIYLLSDTGIGGLGAWFDNNVLFKVMKSGDCHTTDKESIASLMEKTGFRVIRCEKLKNFIYTVVGVKQ